MPNTIPGASKSPDVLCSCVQMPLLSGRSQLIIPEGRLRGQHVMFGQGLSVQFSSVQLLSRVQLFVTLWTACQASLSITNSRSLLKLISIESVMPSNHLILCCPLLLSPSIFPSIRVFSKESVLCIRLLEFSFSISPSNEYSGLISFRMD